MKNIQKNVYWVTLSVILLFAATTVSYANTHRKSAKPRVQTATVLITEQGFSKTRIVLRRGVLTRITFLRKTDDTCATSILIAAFGVNRELPLNKPVVVTFTPKAAGEFAFTCGMKMMHGKLVVH